MPPQVILASAVGVRLPGRVTALGGALTASADVLQLVLDLGQPAARGGVLRLQVGYPLLEGGDMGQLWSPLSRFRGSGQDE